MSRWHTTRSPRPCDERVSGVGPLRPGRWFVAWLLSLRTDCMRTGCGVAGLLSSCGECGERMWRGTSHNHAHIITQDTELRRTALAPSPIWPRQPANLPWPSRTRSSEHGGHATTDVLGRRPAAGSPRASFWVLHGRQDDLVTLLFSLQEDCSINILTSSSFTAYCSLCFAYPVGPHRIL